MGAIKADQIRKDFMRLTKSIGLEEVTAPKTLRHTFATCLQDANVDPLIRNELMGHSPRSTAAPVERFVMPLLGCCGCELYGHGPVSILAGSISEDHGTLRPVCVMMASPFAESQDDAERNLCSAGFEMELQFKGSKEVGGVAAVCDASNIERAPIDLRHRQFWDTVAPQP